MPLRIISAVADRSLGSEPQAVLLADLDVAGHRVRRVTWGNAVLLHGRDLFVAFGYRNPETSLSQFALKSGHVDHVVTAPFPDTVGRLQPMSFVTLEGLFAVVAQMSPRMAVRPAAVAMVTTFIARMLPGRTLASDEALKASAVDAIGALNGALRLVASLRSQIARYQELARASAADVGDVQERLEQADADQVLPGRIDKLLRENARLRDDLERERRSRHMADKDLALAQADAKRWRAEVEHVVLNAPLELLPFLAEPDDGGVH